MEKFSTNKKTYFGMFIVFFIFMVFSYFLFHFISLTIIFIFGIILIKSFESLKSFYLKIFKKLTFLHFGNSFLASIPIFGLFGLFFYLVYYSILDLSIVISEAISENVFLQISVYLRNEFPQITSFIFEKIQTDSINSGINTYLYKFSSFLIEDLFTFIFLSILIIPLMFETFKKLSKEKAFEKFVNKFPKKISKIINTSLTKISRELNNFFKIKINQTIILSIISCLGFFILGLEGWFVLGIFVGFMNIIPYLGPIIGAVLPLMMGLLIDPYYFMYTLIILTFVQVVDNFYISPRLIPGYIKVDSFFVIMLTLMGAQLYGAAGLILFLPLYLILRILLIETYYALFKIYDTK
jgi:predicted PurR-regulated permease PerM